MKLMFAPPEFDRDTYYETTSRTIRWVCLALVIITYPPNHLGDPMVATTLAVALLYNCLHYTSLHRSPWLASRFNSLIVDHLFVFVLIFLSGGLASPYYPFFFLLLVAVIASFGIAGFAITLAAQVVLTLILLGDQTPAIPAGNDAQLIIKLLFLVLFGLVAEQTVRSNDQTNLFETRFTRRVEDERQRLLALINSLSSAVLAVDETGHVYLYNAASLELLNTNRDISGNPLWELLPLHREREPDKIIDIFKLAHDQDKVISRQDLVLSHEDGSEIILDLTISPVHLQDSAVQLIGPAGYMVVFRDITKEKSLEEERNEFISVTSHELRTPLAIAEANISTALLPGFAKIDDKAKALLEQTHANIIFLSQLIEDLATLSRAERGNLKFESSLVVLKSLADDLIRDYRPSAEAKRLELKLEFDPKVKNVLTSEHELREILQNFITNAIKYTQEGSVTLAIVGHPQSAEISVKDTGIGLSASDKTKIFAKFYRSEDFRTRQTSGTGLGLYITKKLAERLGMTIHFTSRLNHGSAFTLTIPYHVSSVEAKSVAESAQADQG